MSCEELTPPAVAQIPDALRVPLDSLHADAGYLIGRVLDKSLTADDVVSIIRSRIDEARAALAAPAHPATAGDAVYDAIGILTEFADDLCSCHTITPDDWDDEPDAKAEYDRIIRCVAQLQAMRASKGGE